MVSSKQPVSLAHALWRGFTMRCPNCGQGRLFGRYLKVVDHCAVCGEDYSCQRADDFPPYLVIIVIGHLTVPAVFLVEELFAPPIWLQYVIWLPLIAFAALALLQPTKGAVVALQWQLGMHGFDQTKRRHAAASRAACKRAVRPDARTLPQGPLTLAECATTRSTIAGASPR